MLFPSSTISHNTGFRRSVPSSRRSLGHRFCTSLRKSFVICYSLHIGFPVSTSSCSSKSFIAFISSMSLIEFSQMCNIFTATNCTMRSINSMSHIFLFKFSAFKSGIFSDKTLNTTSKTRGQNRAKVVKQVRNLCETLTNPLTLSLVCIISLWLVSLYL